MGQIRVNHTTKGRKLILWKLERSIFFNDPSVLSFRILEHEDDNGKYIEEQELWRPLGMGESEYNEKIKVCFLNILFFCFSLISSIS
jgi:hypothetical protein